MKILHKIELFVQVISILAAAAFALASISDGDFLLGVLIVQFWLGVEQYVSSLISCMVKSTRWTEKAKHLKLSTIYLAILVVGAGLNVGNVLHPSIAIGFMFMLPWALAMYYVIITWKEAFPSQRNNGHFLPHTSF